jgi:hypothetical protein
MGLTSLLAAEDSLPSVADLQRAYLEQNGGPSTIHALKSIVADGEILDPSGNARAFKLYRKRPNFYRMEIKQPGVTIITAHDGIRSRRKLEFANGERRMAELNQAENQAISHGSEFDSLFYKLRGRPDLLRIVGLTEVKGTPAYEIAVSPSAQTPYDRIWLDAENYQELKLRRQVAEESGNRVVEEVFFSDFKRVDGVWLATEVVQQKAESPGLTISIDRVRTNVGLFDSFFEKL